MYYESFVIPETTVYHLSLDSCNFGAYLEYSDGLISSWRINQVIDKAEYLIKLSNTYRSLYNISRIANVELKLSKSNIHNILDFKCEKLLKNDNSFYVSSEYRHETRGIIFNIKNGMKLEMEERICLATSTPSESDLLFYSELHTFAYYYFKKNAIIQ
jgi:hypothetical protein